MEFTLEDLYTKKEGQTYDRKSARKYPKELSNHIIAFANADERLQLMYAKGSRYYEDEPVYRSSMEDIDWDFVAEYCKKIGYQKSATLLQKGKGAFYPI